MRWSQCNEAAIGMCSGVWCSWGVVRFNFNQRTAALLTRDVFGWAAHMIERQARISRAWRQLASRTHEIQCDDSAGARIRRYELLSTSVVAT
eukprot:3962476-Pyramimonas_sp.AAC.1